MGGVLRRAGEHERVKALLSTYLDGHASDAERALVERHLATCADCTRNLATLRATVTAIRQMPKVRAPRSFALSRSLARPPQTAPWLYPLLRAATAVAAFLFVLTVAGDLFLRLSLTTPAPIAVPAALAPTAVVMQSEARSAPQATAPTATSEPQKSAPPAAPAPQATPPRLGLAAPGTVTPSIAAAAQVAPPTPVEPPVEQPLTGGGMGGGMGGGTGPGAASVPPQPASTAPARASAPTAAATALVASPSPAPTAVARAPAPQPSADQRETAAPVIRPAVNLLRVAEDMLAVLVLVLGVTTWIVRRRNQ